MRQKLKPDQDLDCVQADLIETVCFLYSSGKSVRAVGKEMDISPMKVRKILITGKAYSSELSTEIGELWRDGKTVGEIAELLNTTTANVNSYLPYERIIYNMEERSVEADRQKRYRDRLRSRVNASDGSDGSDGSGVNNDEVDKPGSGVVETPVERIRTKTLIIVIGRKLRKLIPAEVLDDSSNPLARDKSYTWGSNIGGEFVIHEAPDPDKMIWCAEVTTSGRGAKKKQGIVLMSANCGFCCIAPLPSIPVLIDTDVIEDYVERRKAEEENENQLKAYRSELETAILDAIRSGFLAFCLPEHRVLDYTDTVRRVEIVKGKPSFPQTRLEDLIEQDLNWAAGADPMTTFNIRGNWTSRKFGNSTGYRAVDMAVITMLGLNDEEQDEWLRKFTAPMRERLNANMEATEAE